MSSSLAYTRSGSGAPLVLLHGIGLSRRSWAPVIPALARHFDVIAVDLPGFGDSPATTEASPAALAVAVAGLLTELGVTTPHLARHAARPLSRLVRYRLGRALALGQTHGHPARLTPGYARETLAALGTCPGFEAALAATSTCRYLATAPITAPV